MQIKNNFNAFKDDFKKDTGMDAKSNIAEYIQYANFRINDQLIQFSTQYFNSVLNEIGWFPSKISPTIMNVLKEYKKLP